MQGLRVLEQNFDVNLVNFFFSVEVILRAEAVEQAQAGDKCDFTGSLIVVPDVAQISTPGKMHALHKGTQNSMKTQMKTGKKQGKLERNLGNNLLDI